MHENSATPMCYQGRKATTLFENQSTDRVNEQICDKSVTRTMKGKYHIAVLECDTPVERIQTRYGTYGDIFERLLKRGLAGLKELPGRAGDSVDVELALSKWLVVDNQIYPNPDDVDAILLTGSSKLYPPSSPSRLASY